MPNDVEVCGVQLPGRERRFGEPPHTNLMELVTVIANAWKPTPIPFALLGVSMGGWLEFELARELRRRGQQGPTHMFIVAINAPHIKDTDNEHLLSLDEWIAKARSRGELSDEELAAREILELMFPMIVADAALTETHTYVDEPPLACPITAYAVTRDVRIEADQVRAWESYTTGGFTFEMVEGEHNLLKTAPEPLIERVAARLRTQP